VEEGTGTEEVVEGLEKEGEEGQFLAAGKPSDPFISACKGKPELGNVLREVSTLFTGGLPGPSLHSQVYPTIKFIPWSNCAPNRPAYCQ
jgi:hypothetical protein